MPGIPLLLLQYQPISGKLFKLQYLLKVQRMVLALKKLNKPSQYCYNYLIVM
ncbi:unnamed protein product [Lathyrus sativus]|nr:unnamed protein product [Lathyrus sativus]